MSCDCFDKVKNKVITAIKEDLPEHVEFSGNWENSVLFLSNDHPSIPVIIPFKYSYREIKTNGEHYKKMTNNKMNVTMSYCPFCGESTKSEVADVN